MIATIEAAPLKAVLGLPGTDSEPDTTLEALTSELQPVLELSVQPEALADASLEPLLKLAFSEVIAGEYLARQLRANAVFETIQIGSIRISPPSNFLDPSGLIGRGYARLRPFLRPEAFSGAGTVRTGGSS